MKKIYKISAFLLLLSSNLFAQYSTDWIRPADNYQKTGVMMVRDNLDNVMVTGYWESNNIYTRKYDKFGNLQWEVMSTSGVAGNYEKPRWINVDSNNNVFVVGYRYTGTSQQYPNALVVLKYSPAGTLLWKNTISMTIFVNNFISFNLRSEVDNNGNLYIGTVAVTPSGFVLVKLDPSGNTLFTSNNNLNGVTMFRSMRLKGDKLICSGSSSNLSAAIAIAWDTTGNLLWTTSLLGKSGNDIEIDDAGNAYLLTSYADQVTAGSGQDIMIYKLNSSGAQVWVQNFDFGGNDFPTRFTLVNDKISVIGYGSISASYFDWITFQINTGGTMLWNTRYNETTLNDEQSYFIAAKANGDVFVTGWGGPAYTLFGNSYLRMITAKYDNTGVRKWVDSVNIYSGKGVACTLAGDNSLFVLSNAYTTAFHFLDHDGSAVAAVPTGLTVSNVTNSSALFSWTPVSGAYLYHLRYKLTAASTWTVTSTNLTSINITGLSPNTSYDYASEAINSGGPSGYSSTQTFTTASSPLAVSGITFNAVRQGQNVLLTWSTLSEQNSAYYDVERSYDGIGFNKIGQVPAAGNSSNLMNYRFTELDAAKLMIFYRLKMVDVDAGYRFSPVRVVPKLDRSSKIFLVYPNPAGSNINIVLNDAATENLQLQIINPIGQLVRVIEVLKGTQFIKLDVSELPKGIYVIKLTGRETADVNKLVIR